jgi:uncharacterized protein (DUF2384 family)
MTIIVISEVHSDETTVTGVLYGFDNEDQAEKWIEQYHSEWNERSDIDYLITEANHYREML